MLSILSRDYWEIELIKGNEKEKLMTGQYTTMYVQSN